MPNIWSSRCRRARTLPSRLKTLQTPPLSKLSLAKRFLPLARGWVKIPARRNSFVRSGNPGLAKGGSGDVLSGVLAALTGQFSMQDWLRVLALGAWLHGRAADSLIKDADLSGIVAGDVARALPHARFELLEEIRRGG